MICPSNHQIEMILMICFNFVQINFRYNLINIPNRAYDFHSLLV